MGEHEKLVLLEHILKNPVGSLDFCKRGNKLFLAKSVFTKNNKDDIDPSTIAMEYEKVGYTFKDVVCYLNELNIPIDIIGNKIMWYTQMYRRYY